MGPRRATGSSSNGNYGGHRGHAMPVAYTDDARHGHFIPNALRGEDQPVHYRPQGRDIGPTQPGRGIAAPLQAPA